MITRRSSLLLMLLAGCATAPPDPTVDASITETDAAITPDVAPAVDAAADPPLRVLFVGNSYTDANDLPMLVHAIGAATPGVGVEVESATEGSATFGSLWASGVAPARIASGHFDAVVLQGNSLEAVGTAEFFYPSARMFGDATIASGARPIWYATWARRTGDSFYAAGMTTPEFMTRSIDHAYRRAASESGGVVARVGTAFQRALTEGPAVELYWTDGSHPSPAGTLLAACTIFFALTGREPTVPDPTPFDLDRNVALALCAIGSRVLCDAGSCACESATHVTTGYAALAATTPACDGTTERRGLDCNAAMSAACEATACATSGFGLGMATGDATELTCVSGTTLHTTYAALAAIDAGCDGTTERYGPHCLGAIDHACAATGALGGFGPTTVVGDDVTATCLPAANAMRENIPFNQLAAYDGNCNGTVQRWGEDCDIAIDSFCRTQGFAGGFGPTGTPGTNVEFVCAAW